MNRFRKYLPGLVAALVGAAMLAAPSQARASFAISVFVDGVNQGVPLNGASDANDFFIFKQTVSFFKLSIDAQTNWSGSQAGSLMTTTSNGTITTAFGPNGGTHTLTVVISENGWLAPVGTPLTLSSSAGGTIGSGGDGISVLASNQGFLDIGNGLATTQTPAGQFTPFATGSASLLGTGTANVNYFPGTGVNPSVTGGTPFALTQVYSWVITTTGSTADTVNVSGSVSVTVPAPAGLMLALTGAPFLGVGAWLRRRRQAV